MNEDDIRSEWCRFRRDASDRAQAAKQSQQVIYDLINYYQSLSEDERVVVDMLLADDLDSTNEADQFDALALIREFQIQSALPALRALADRLELEHSARAPYEWSKVNGLIGLLTAES